MSKDSLHHSGTGIANGIRNGLDDGANDGGLRHRANGGSEARRNDVRNAGDDEVKRSGKSEASQGKPETRPLGRLPNGQTFRVPTTGDVLSGLFDPRHHKGTFDMIILSMLAGQCLLWLSLSLSGRRYIFLLLFIGFRASYDVGLGVLLYNQSCYRSATRFIKASGLVDGKAKSWLSRPQVRMRIKKELESKIGDGYNFDEAPVEFTTWLLFRHLVDLILINDFLSYTLFAFSWAGLPQGHSWGMHVLRWAAGWTLVAFNLWVKVDAHRVIKDFAWYWGDFFFLVEADLTFDGVFEMAPHPMYSVGYAGYYGLSIITASYMVMGVSIAAHAAQFIFLNLVENPHIEKTYGEHKSFTAKLQAQAAATLEGSPSPVRRRSTATNPITPGTVADLQYRYFNRDLVTLHPLDLHRSDDLALLTLIVYAGVLPTLFRSLDHFTLNLVLFAQAVVWRVIHSFVLGFILRNQSENKSWTKHFLKYGGSVTEAFANWKAIYNLSLVMTHCSFYVVAWRLYHLAEDWTVGTFLLRHTLGAGLILLHIWTATEVFEVLGPFGWFFGDFFLEDYQPQLYYTGIYRFLNNPEKIASSYWGFALISGSRSVLGLAIFSTLAHLAFLNLVEKPHMRKLYGDTIRNTGGISKVVFSAAAKNVGQPLGKRAPELERVAQEMVGSLEKVTSDTSHLIEDFVANAKPKWNGYLEDTKIFVQRTRDKMLIARVETDMSQFDIDRYSVSIKPTRSAGTPPTPDPSRTRDVSIMRFHLGEPITLQWRAPSNHSRKDWIGVYKSGANSSTSVTKISSRGRWMPVHEEEWEGDVEIPGGSRVSSENGHPEIKGEVRFQGKKLPWTQGTYEFRYSHDGKHNVMAIAGPVEIVIDPLPADRDSISLEQTTEYLVPVIHRCLDSDTSLGPAPIAPHRFTVMSNDQAERIVYAIRVAFGVEFSPDVIAVDGDAGRLAKRILEAKRILRPFRTCRDLKSASALLREGQTTEASGNG